MRIRFSGWLASGALVMALGGPLPGSAQAVGERQLDEQDQSVNTQSVKPRVDQQMLLAAVSSAPTAKGPEAVPAPPSMALSSFNWGGFYVGGHGGSGTGNGNMVVNPLPDAATFVNLGPTKIHTNPDGIIGGIQGGYNWQRGHIVFGGEGDYTFSGMDGSRVIAPIIQNNGTPFPGSTLIGNHITAHQDTDWTSTVRARVGLAVVPRLLLYGTGGLAFGHVTYFGTTDFRPVGTEQYPAFAAKTKTGYTAGFGSEVGLLAHFTARFEYLYYNLGSQVITASPVPALPPFGIRYTWATSARLARAGVNFKF
ncbi:MAG TPA: outer membrane beta-barrel protein [Candidatus Saccharimonadales bacterium]|nr:outer membrane beta-barrel protein [Candidatus Saccharimonadales bacterium]